MYHAEVVKPADTLLCQVNSEQTQAYMQITSSCKVNSSINKYWLMMLKVKNLKKHDV